MLACSAMSHMLDFALPWARSADTDKEIVFDKEVSFAAREAAAEQLLARIVFLVFHGLLDLNCSLGDIVLSRTNVCFYVVQHAALLLHQQRQLEEEFVDVPDAALQLQQLLVPVLYLVQSRSGSPPLQEEIIREDVPLSCLNHLVYLLPAHILAHDLCLPLNACFTVLPLDHFSLIVLGYGFVEGSGQGDVL